MNSTPDPDPRAASPLAAKMELFSYFRSSAAYRVRIAANWKGLAPAYAAVDLLQRDPLLTFRDTVNAQGFVPALSVDGDGLVVQSLAIIEYLDERFPMPPLLPAEPADRAYVRAAAMLIACDTHPLANLRVLRYLKRELGQTQPSIDSWYRHWVEDGLGRLEAFVVERRQSGSFLYGESLTLADCCLVPQLYNARRLKCDLSGFPNLVAVDARLAEVDAVADAHPDRQPDAP